MSYLGCNRDGLYDHQPQEDNSSLVPISKGREGGKEEGREGGEREGQGREE